MNATGALRVAAAQYDIGYFPDLEAYERKLADWVARAAAAGAQLLVFPEYGAMELTSLFGPAVQRDLHVQLAALQSVVPEYLAVHERLAARHGVYVLAASLPVRVGEAFHNRAHLFAPTGAMGFQDKLVMTRFERERWGVGPGDLLTVFDTDLGRLAVSICYDSEFPLLARAQVEAGAQILLVPSCTDALAGYHRVRIACQARALENQCYVVQAPTVGSAAWSEAVDVNVGAAGVFVPPDRGLPEDGVVALGPLNEPRWVYADLDLARVEAVRKDGQVLNHRDWSRQADAARHAVRRVDLRG